MRAEIKHNKKSGQKLCAILLVLRVCVGDTFRLPPHQGLAQLRDLFLFFI